MNRYADSSNWEHMSTKLARPSVTDQGGKLTKRNEFFGSSFPEKILNKWVGLDEGSDRGKAVMTGEEKHRRNSWGLRSAITFQH